MRSSAGVERSGPWVPFHSPIAERLSCLFGGWFTRGSRGLEHSLDLQGLVEDLGKVVQNGGLADDQGRPGSLRSRLQFR